MTMHADLADFARANKPSLPEPRSNARAKASSGAGRNGIGGFSITVTPHFSGNVTGKDVRPYKTEIGVVISFAVQIIAVRLVFCKLMNGQVVS